MISTGEKEWRRFHKIREDLSEVPTSKVPTLLDQLQQEGESEAVISMLKLQYRLGQSPELLPGRRLANRYTIKKKIGQGGMGVVYEAVQEMTQQEVALKIMDPALVTPSLMTRFREEIRTLGKLQHDHIVRVFDADYDRNPSPNHDLLFYAMQLVEGVPLIRWVNNSHPTIEARLECFIQICEAVDYAHHHGVVHRDLKPDNILVDGAGRPAILDFGLAQIMDLALDVPKGPLGPEGGTVLQVSGTPAYMSAERWEGHPGGMPADMFALGVLLHEILTGVRPWRVAPDASVNDLRRAICSFSADQLKEHPALSRSLTQLLGSMLAPDPAARPASATEVADVIRTIAVRRRLKRRIRRAAPIWTGIAVAVGSLIATQNYYGRLRRQNWESQQRLIEASQIVRQRSQVDTLARVIRKLPANPRLRHSQDQWRDVVLEAMAGWNLRNGAGVQLPSGFAPITGDPKGTRFFGRSAAGSWEAIERTGGAWVATRFPGQQDILRARINPRQSQLVVLETDGRLVVWQWNQNRLKPLLTSAEPDTQFEFSPDGRNFGCSATVAGPEGGDREPLATVLVYDAGTWKEAARLFKPGDLPEPRTFIYVHSRPIAGLAFNPDGKRLAVWSHESSQLLIWKWVDDQVKVARHRSRLAAAAWRPGRPAAEITSIQENGEIRAWSLQSATNYLGYGIERRQRTGSFKGWLAWSAGGAALAAVDNGNQTMTIFAADAGPGGFHLQLGSAGSGGMRWCCNGLLKSGEGGHEWVPFDSEPPVRRALNIPGFSPTYLTFNSDGTILAAADSTKILLIASTSGAILALREMPLSGPIVFDATSGDLWIYNKTKGPMRWKISPSQNGLTNDVPGPIPGRQSPVGKLAAAGGHLVFSRGINIFVFADPTVSKVREPPDITVDAPPQQLAISTNGQQVAAIWSNPMRAELWGWHKAGWSRELRITNAPVLANLPEWKRTSPLTIRPSQQITAEEKALESQFTHFRDSTLVTPAARLPLVAWSGGLDQGIHLDYLGPESCVHVARLPFEREYGLHTALALSPDGMRLATVNSKGEIQIWDLRRALRKLAELRLGIDEIHLKNSGPSEEASQSLTIVGPG